MALSSITAALTQFNANANWYGSRDAAALRLEAVEYLLVNRGQTQGDAGTTLSYESLATMGEVLRKFLGAGPSRAFGRSRRLVAGFGNDGGIQ